ncbi:hypothetical protein Taro_046554, partial [Colocasia esculenta]|nr:hypothetical protein [Colocasia esculenta]
LAPVNLKLVTILDLLLQTFPFQGTKAEREGRGSKIRGLYRLGVERKKNRRRCQLRGGNVLLLPINTKNATGSEVYQAVKRFAACIGTLMSAASPMLSSSSSSTPTSCDTISRIHVKARWLIRMLAWVQATLDDAEDMNITEESIRDWLRELREVADAAEDLLDEFPREALRLGFVGDGGWTAESITELPIQRNRTSEMALLHDQRMEEIVSRFMKIKKPEQALKIDYRKEQMDAESIYGSRTTSSVIEEPHILKSWVCVSEDFDVIRLTKAMLQSLNVEASGLSELDPLQRKLLQKLEGQGRLLLVLDDVWEADNLNIHSWNLFTVPLRNSSADTKIIMTTRSSKVSEVLARNSTYDLGFLMEHLRVLDLHGVWFHHLSESIARLKHLRYLRMSIKKLPAFVGSMHHLQTLDLEGVSRLPNSMSNLLNLRHLIMSSRYIEFPKGIGKLTDLQTVPGFYVSSEHHRAKLGELKDMNNIRGQFGIDGLHKLADVNEAKKACLDKKRSISSLHLGWDPSADSSPIDDEVLESLKPTPKLESLQISNFKGPSYPSWLGDRSFFRLGTITLVSCENWVSLPPLAQLPSLKSLCISDARAVEYIGSEFFSGGFPQLEELTLTNMDNWNSWCSAQEGECPKLKKLSIGSCPKLESLSLINLGALEDIFISWCTRLPYMSGNFLELLHLQHAQTIKISKNLKEWWIQRAIPLDDKTNLYLEDAGQQEADYVLDVFSHICRLTVKKCRNLTSLPLGNQSSLVSLEISVCRKLRITSVSPQLWQLPCLKRIDVHWVHGAESIEVVRDSYAEFTNVDQRVASFLLKELSHMIRRLTIIRCANLTSLPWTYLTTMEYLIIRECPLFRLSDDEQLPPTLQVLCISGNSCVREQVWPRPYKQGADQNLYLVFRNVHDASEAADFCSRIYMQIHTLEIEWDCCTNDRFKVLDSVAEEVLGKLYHPLGAFWYKIRKLDKLVIQGYTGSRFGSSLWDRRLHWLSSVTLQQCSNCEILPPLSQLCSLKELFVEGASSLETFAEDYDISEQGWQETQTRIAFPSLQKLEFRNMPVWKEWLGTKEEDFPLLCKLILKQCPKLRVLPHFPPGLRELGLEACHELTSLSIFDSPNHAKSLISLKPRRRQSLSTTKGTSPILRHMSLTNCPLLLALCEEHPRILAGIPNLLIDGVRVQTKHEKKALPDKRNSLLCIYVPELGGHQELYFRFRSRGKERSHPNLLPCSGEMTMEDAIRSTVARAMEGFTAYVGTPPPAATWSSSSSSSSTLNNCDINRIHAKAQWLIRMLSWVRATLDDAEDMDVTEESVRDWLRELQAITDAAEDVLDELPHEALRLELVENGGRTAGIITEDAVDETVQATAVERPPRQGGERTWEMSPPHQVHSSSSVTPLHELSAFLFRVDQRMDDIVSRFMKIKKPEQALTLDCRGEQVHAESISAKRTTSSVIEEPHIVGRDKDLAEIKQFLLSIYQKLASYSYTRMEHLRVLDLGGVRLDHLPESVTHLKHLRYLRIADIVQQLPEFVGSMYHLQTLDAPGVHELPNSMSNLHNLRHLILSSSDTSIAYSVGIGKLADLQTMPGFLVSPEHCHAKLGELKDMNSIRGQFSIERLENLADRNISYLCLAWDPSAASLPIDDEVLESLKPSVKLASLIISNFKGPSYPSWLGDLSFFRLGIIFLFSCRSWTFLPPLGQLPSLKSLYISNGTAVEYIGSEFFSGGFPQLEKLTLSEMDNWKSWCSAQAGQCPKLKKFSIYSCHNLESLPSLGLLPSLRVLSIYEASAVKNIGSEFFSGGFPQLEELTLSRMDNWKSWCGAQEGDYPKLKKLSIDSCPNLESLSLINLGVVEIISISGCPKLRCIPGHSLEVSHLQRAKTIKIKNIYQVGLIEAAHLYTAAPVEDQPPCLQLEAVGRREAEYILGMCSHICRLTVKRCSTLTSLPFGFSHMICQLTITECANLASLPWTDLITLEYLRISDCPLFRLLDAIQLRPPTLQVLCIYENPHHTEQCSNGGDAVTEKVLSDFYSLCISSKKLVIRGSENFLSKKLCSDFHHSRLSSVSLLQCSTCEILPALCKLPFLEELYVRGASNLENVVLDSLSSYDQMTEQEWQATYTSIAFPRLQKLEFHDMPLVLKRCPRLRALPHLPPGLKELYLEGCEELRSLSSSSQNLKSLTSLWNLSVTNCPNLDFTATEGPPPRLELMSLTGCPLLLAWCEGHPRMLEPIPNIWVDGVQVSPKRRQASI